MVRVSIVMATYNGEKYLREQMESIIANTYGDWFLEICDDGSTDQTIAIAKEYEEKYPFKIHLHQNERNLGVVQNFLEGAKRASGKYIMFCDQDDVWLPYKIGHTLKKLRKMERQYGKDKPLSVFSDARVTDEKLSQLNPSFHGAGRLNVKKLDLPHILMENKMIGCTVMCNRRVLKYLSVLPSSARYHDWWIAIICAAFGKIGYLPEATLLYRQHEKNVVGNQNYFSYVKNRIGSLTDQRKALAATRLQAMNFYELFLNELPPKEKTQVYEFACLDKTNLFIRRYKILKYGFLKTGVVRNAGLLLVV